MSLAEQPFVDLFDRDLERSILGSILIGCPDEAFADLEVEYFSIPAHADVFRAILAVRDQGMAPDLMALTAWFRDHGWPVEFGQAELAQTSEYDCGYALLPQRIRQLKSYAQKRRARRLAITLPGRIASANGDISQVLSDAASLHDQIQAMAESRARASTPVEYLDLDGIREHGIPAIDWLIPGWIVAGEIAVLAGDPSTGKSTTACAMAIAVAGLGHWCGIEPATTGTVLYFDQEQDIAELSDIMLRLGGPVPSLRVACQQGIDLNAGIVRLELEIKEHRPVLVVLDSMMAVFGVASLSKMEECLPVYAAIHRLRNTYGCAFLFLTHFAKPPSDNRGRKEIGLLDVFGSIAHSAQIGTLWLVRGKRDDIGSSIVLEQHKRRRVSKLLAMKIEYHSAGEAMPITLTGHHATPSGLLAQVSHDRKLKSMERVFEAVDGQLGWVSRATVEAITGFSKAVVNGYLGDLAEAGRLVTGEASRGALFYSSDTSTDSPAFFDSQAGQ